MIKFEHTEVLNLNGAIRGMRNPLESWDKDDSETCSQLLSCDKCKYENTPICDRMSFREVVVLGENNTKLMKSLIKGGSDHRKFMRQIFVSVDIIAPLYWWKEFDTYKVGTVSNSCSTMHTIHKKEFTRDDFSHERMDPRANDVLDSVIYYLNTWRNLFIETKDKCWWENIIQLLPSSYNQRRTVTLNYEVIYNIYHSQRKTHKLDEWRVGFMEWIESLPFADELIKD